ncbi:MAG: TIGR00730 family Rossman fold protein [Clostridia bacterium]|nr:TIGR00730 family Rossman fold protein [Clostridia bacterium]
MNICVYGAASNKIDRKYIEETEYLGEAMAKRGDTLVFGGGAGGVMGATARGMTRGGGKIIGVAPTFFVDGVLYQECTEFHSTETMRQRKQIMEDNADGFIVAPGGIGTFEEFFEILTLKQLNRHEKPIVILNVGGYYDKLLAFLDYVAAEQFMSESCKELYHTVETADEALDYLEHYQAHMRSTEEYKNLR